MTETPRNVGPDDARGDTETHAATLKPPTEPPMSGALLSALSENAANLRAQLRTADDAITAVTRQRDAARAEVERLRAAVAELAEDAADRHWRSRAAAHSYYARILAAMATS